MQPEAELIGSLQKTGLGSFKAVQYCTWEEEVPKPCCSLDTCVRVQEVLAWLTFHPPVLRHMAALSLGVSNIHVAEVRGLFKGRTLTKLSGGGGVFEIGVTCLRLAGSCLHLEGQGTYYISTWTPKSCKPRIAFELLFMGLGHDFAYFRDPGS